MSGGGGYAWKEREVELVRKTYPSQGAAAAQRSLTRYGFKRTVDAVSSKAFDLGLRHDPTKKGTLVALVDALAIKRGKKPPAAHSLIVNAARRAGVLTRAPLPPKAFLAPREWVDAFMERYARDRDRHRALTGQWLTTVQAAALFDVRPHALATIMTPSRDNGHLLAAHARKATSILVRVDSKGGQTTKRFWEPVSTRQAAMSYRAARSRSRWHKRGPAERGTAAT